MNAALFGHHTVAHVEAMKEDRGSSEGELRDFEDNSSLQDKVHPLGAAGDLFRNSEPILNRR
jgi:hypothetical protein